MPDRNPTPIDDGWEEVLVRNVLHYLPVLHYVPIMYGPKWHSLRSCHFRAQKSLDFQGPPLPMPLEMMLHPSKSLRTVP